jgi:hypothetical protein
MINVCVSVREDTTKMCPWEAGFTCADWILLTLGLGKVWAVFFSYKILGSETLCLLSDVEP